MILQPRFQIPLLLNRDLHKAGAFPKSQATPEAGLEPNGQGKRFTNSFCGTELLGLLVNNETAGDRIRTDDVQLGKNEPLFSEKLLKPSIPAAYRHPAFLQIVAF